jgi:type I restriction enzyme S subunit
MTEEIKARIESIRKGEAPEGYKKAIPYIIPQDWQVKKLGTITKRTSRPNNDGKDRPAYSINNRKGFVPQSEQFEDGSYQDLDKTAYKIVRRGGVAYNPARVNVGSIGRLRDEDEVIVSSLYVCVGVDDSINGEYFDAWTKTRDFFEETVRNTEGSVREYLFYENFANMRMPVPEITEQQKIAAILATCQHVIELKELLLDEKRKQKQWLMKVLFTPDSDMRLLGFEKAQWKQISLGDECVMFSGGTPKAGKDEYYSYGTIPFIRSGEISKTYTELFLTELGYKNCSAKMIEIGDILYALYGANSGDCSISKMKGAINQAILCIRPRTIDRELLYYLLCLLKEKIVSTYLQGGQGNLSAEIIKKLVVNVPADVKYQKAIIERLIIADKEISLLEQELEIWQQKKKALMQLLLTGLVRTNN